jgi:hypothetical protein
MLERPDRQPSERRKIVIDLQRDGTRQIPLEGRTKVMVAIGKWAFRFTRRKSGQQWILTVAQFEFQEEKFLHRLEEIRLNEGHEFPLEASSGFLQFFPPKTFPPKLFTIRFANGTVEITLQCDLNSKVILLENP